MIEFTGERVVPGQVDVDLWNEHLARYTFAARLAAGKKVLDAGCGTGYGSAVLAQRAASVTGLDIAPEAIAYARENYGASGALFVEGSCLAMPLPEAAFDLVVSFEVIEHLADWKAFLGECKRVLAPGGVLLLSTPNREYYLEARRRSGPNPFHTHEFDYDELSSVLAALFSQVHVYVQNHVDGIALQPISVNGAGQPELLQAGPPAEPRVAHFFLAVCSSSLDPAPPALIYIPSTANVLHERELHINKLEVDVEGLREEKQRMVEMFRVQETALEEANHWSRDLDAKLGQANERIMQLQAELQQMATGYQAQIATLDTENRTKTEWALQLDKRLAAANERILELQSELEARDRLARDLDQQIASTSARITGLQSELEQLAATYGAKLSLLETEACARSEWGQRLTSDLEESNRKVQALEESVAGYAGKVAELEQENNAKTKWARGLEAELEARTKWALDMETQLKCVSASRWVRLGNRIGLGPRLGGN